MKPDDEAHVQPEPDSAAEAGILENPEVPAEPIPMPTTFAPVGSAPVGLPIGPVAPPPPSGPASPWARPSAAAPPPVWDSSGYAPPPAIRIDQGHAPGTLGFVGLYPLPPAPAPQVAVVETAPPVKAEAPRTNRWTRVQLPTGITILLFIAGLAIGAVGLRLATPAHPNVPDGFPTLNRTAIEPLPASAVAQELAKNDVHGLAQLLNADALTAIQTQLKPFVTFESVTFVGATTDQKDTIAGYVVRGRDASGNLGLVGLMIRLRDGQVVAQ